MYVYMYVHIQYTYVCTVYIYICIHTHIHIHRITYIYIYNGHICNMSNYMSTCSQDVSHYQYQSLPCFMGPISPVWLLVPGSIKQPSFRSAGAFHVPKPLQPNSSPPDESSGASSWWPWKFEQICHFCEPLGGITLLNTKTHVNRDC